MTGGQRRALTVGPAVLANVGAGLIGLFTSLAVIPIYISSLGPELFGYVAVIQAAAQIAITIDFGHSSLVARRASLGHTPYVRSDRAMSRSSIKLGPLGLLAAAGMTIIASSQASSDVVPSAILSAAVFGGLLPLALRFGLVALEGSLHLRAVRATMVGCSAARLTIAFLSSDLPPTLRLPICLIAELSPLWAPAALGAILCSRRPPPRSIPFPDDSAVNQDRFRRESFAANIAAALVLNADLLIAGYVLDGHELAIFATATRLVQAYRQIQSWVIQPLAARATQHYGRVGLTGLRDLWSRGHPAVPLIAMTVLASIGLTAGIVGAVWPSLDGIDAGTTLAVLLILLAATAAASAHQITAMLIATAGRPAALLPIQLCWAASKACGVIAAGATHGAVGVALAICVVTTLLEPAYIARGAHVLHIPFRRAAIGSLLPAIAGTLILLAAAAATVASLWLAAAICGTMAVVMVAAAFPTISKLRGDRTLRSRSER